MPRTMRSQAVPTNRVRFRHRSWMRSMTLATVGWGVVWCSLAAAKWGLAAPAGAVYLVSGVPAAVGAFLALTTIRARKPWVLMTLVALFANASLLALPALFDDDIRAALLR
ncbi:MAG: hypothetical protein P8R43_03500 [Planctomycetota bacterium]|nr:hypothetical protein [Planctomycetota bacterium]